MKLSPSLSLLAALIPLTLAVTVPADHRGIARTLQSRGVPGNKPVIIQMFQWSYDSVAAECATFIGPAGYGWVQVSPATEHIQGAQWWTDYQVVSYKLESKHGNRDALKRMIDTCHRAGVKVIIDTVLNHMAGIDSGVGTAGSQFQHYDYPGIYQYQDFHHCSNPGSDIKDYDNRPDAQECELSNLADLNTSSEYVRNKLAEHVRDLLSLGVDGLRLDAAKHIFAGDIQAILDRVSPKPQYITQEAVIWTNNNNIKATDYTRIGDVQEFRFASEMKNVFIGGDLNSLQNIANRDWTPTDKANTFVCNHDSERAGYSLNANSPDNTYVLASIFNLAHPYGTPTVLSSYSGFGDNGGPNGGYGTCDGAAGTKGWLCQHRWTAISGMVKFRNTCGNANVTNWLSEGKQRIAFGRGNLGFVAINNNGNAWAKQFSTQMPNGSYCDVVSGCTIKVSVNNGRLSVTVPARSAIAIHVGSRA